MDAMQLNKLKTRKLCSFGLLLCIFTDTTACIFFALFTKISPYFYLAVIVFGVVPAIILLYFNHKDIKYLSLIKNAFCYIFMVLFFFIAIFAGGIRSISLTVLYLVPIAAFVLEVNIIICSVIITTFFSTLVIIWSIPLLDKFLLKINTFPLDALIIPNPTYIIIYYIVLFAIVMFMYFFRKRDIEYKETIQKTNKELEEAYLKLKEENQKRIDFFINIAHETRTPLSLIQHYLNEFINKNKLTFELNVIKTNIEKLLRDMVNFLDIQKLERGQVYYDHSKIIEFTEMLKEKIILFKTIGKNKNIKFDSDVNSESIYIKVDPSAIDRILNNILDNSIKYNKDNGKIKIKIIAFHDKIDLIFEDTGIGISEDEMKFVFEPYHQMLHEKRQYQGLGMGLSIVKKIIDEINGTIKVESKVNEGTVFKLTLQRYILQENDKVQKNIKYSIPANSPAVELMPESFSKNKPTVLVVEDNIEFLVLMQNTLKEKYNFYYAKDGKEALDKLGKIKKPDVIIADIMMPNMDGFAFLDELIKIEKYNNIPFIFLTARTRIDDRLKGLKKGAVDFITKPVDTDELTAKIENIINRNKKTDNDKKKLIDTTQKLLKLALMNNEETIIESIEEKCRKYKLNDKETKIVLQILDGKEYKEIPDILGISVSTVKWYMTSIFKKVKVDNRAQLINFFKK